MTDLLRSIILGLGVVPLVLVLVVMAWASAYVGGVWGGSDE